MHTLFQSRFLRQFFKYQEHHHPRKPAPPAIEKQRILTALLYNFYVVAYMLPVELNILHRRLAYRHKAFLIALPYHFDEPYIQVKAGKFQCYHLAYAQPAAIHGLQHRMVPRTFRRAVVYGLKQLVYIGQAQHMRQGSLLLGRIQQLGRVSPYHFFKQQVPEKRLYPAQYPGLRRRR
jgi:hypothetical protein